MKNLIFYFSTFIVFTLFLYSFLSIYNQKFISFKQIYIMDKGKFPLSQYSKEFLFKIGRVEDSRKRTNYFLQFPQNKKKGVIRIGTFGDSYTYGVEVEKGWSYPAQLQMIFENSAYKKVEVLNFGMSSHGMQQHFMVWKEYAKKYDIDYILLGPEGAQLNRDPAFTPPWNNRHDFYPPRGRYMLKKDGLLGFVNIRGHTFLERYKSYYTLRPSWTILKYDKYFFNLLKEFHFPFLRIYVHNPFYYSNLSMEEEISAINRILLKQIAKTHYRKIIFFRTNEDMYNLYEKDKDLLNLNRLNLFEKTPLYYRYGHYSTLGYELWAKVFFKALTGQTDFALKIFKCLKKQQEKVLINTEKNIKKIDSLNEVSLYYKKLQIAELESLNFKKSYTLFKDAKSFISFFNSSESFIKGIYQPVPFQLSEKNKVFIKTNQKKELLGSIFPIDEKKLFFAFQADYIFGKKWGSEQESFFPFFDLSKFLSTGEKNIFSYNKTAELYIDNHKIAELKKATHNYRIVWTSGMGYYFTGSLSRSIQHKDLPEKMELSFKYVVGGNTVIDSLVLGFPCIKTSKKIHIDIPNLEFL